MKLFKEPFLSTTFVEDGTLVTNAVTLGNKYNIKQFELGSNHKYENDLKNKLKINNNHYLVHNYFPVPKDDFVINIASHNDAILNKSLEQIKTSLKFCKRLFFGENEIEKILKNILTTNGTS